ncbi:sugar transferase [Motilimonas pumila]|uniref:Sugar transferase n=2 Tax=Motilimonas pumila TaxID=2303987 RepID=A0A418YDB7_9GAMM|nr:sugar transferase [Motilimonas pumila]
MQRNAARNSYIPWTVLTCKRIFDIAFAFTALILLLPLFPLIAVLIKMTSKGPVLYSQVRTGRQTQQGRVFIIYKFRSMVQDAEKNGQAMLASNNDVRITQVGRWLRKTRLDETPQLWNILKGDMSLIGPRPERPVLVDKIEQQHPFFAERTYQVLPGLTGLAQTQQSYLDSVEDIEQKLALDHGYCLSLSRFSTWLKTDCQIVLATVVTVLKCNG